MRAWIVSSVDVPQSVVKLLRCLHASFAVSLVGVSSMLALWAMRLATVRTVRTRQSGASFATRNLVDFASARRPVTLRQYFHVPSPHLHHRHRRRLLLDLPATMGVLSAKTLWMTITAIVLTAATKTSTLVMTAPVQPLTRHVVVPGKHGLFLSILFQCVVLNSHP